MTHPFCKDEGHYFKRVDTQREEEVEETEVAIITTIRLYTVKRCVYCGKVERVFLWCPDREVEWKDNLKFS